MADKGYSDIDISTIYSRKNRQRHKIPHENKKLVYLSGKVLERIKTQQTTTGNWIAQSIIQEMMGLSHTKNGVDFKNIQRRVYDALNVLHALNLINKERNAISYTGMHKFAADATE